MNDTKQSVSERGPEYLAATLREVAETLTDVGKTINARLGAWEETAEPEPKPPSVEVMSAATGALRRYKSITSFVRRGAMWEVYGDTTVGGGTVHTMTTPFAIWQECIAAGVPCCEPPCVTLHGAHTGNPYRYACIGTMRTVSDGTALTGWWAGNDAAWNTCDIISHVVAESPAAIRAACARKGVPCPEEEKRVDVVTLGSVFQQIDRTLSCQIGADCTDPLDHTEFVTPAATPMAPCFTGSDHDHGVWMPIRRSRVNVIATDPTTRFVVDDAEPFKVGDTVHAIDVSGPNAGCTDLGAITLIDYNTNTITVTNNASGLNVDDWIEVTENGCVDVDSDRFKHPRLVGMLKAAHDTRLTAGDTAGVTLPGTVVVNGSIRAADVNFNATPADDELLIVQFSELTPNPDSINIIIAGVPCPEEKEAE